MSKIRVLICPADGRAPHITWISNTLKNLQNIVGGDIESVKLPILCSRSNPVILCNESGRLMKLQPNPCIPDYELVGDLIICHEGREDYESLDTDDAHKLLAICKHQWALNTGRLTPGRYPTR